MRELLSPRRQVGLEVQQATTRANNAVQPRLFPVTQFSHKFVALVIIQLAKYQLTA